MRYLFIGPSLPDAADRVADRGVRVLPPVAAMDLLRLPLSAGDVVGIVDGYFHQRAAVRHKEILAVLDAGVHVLGAASMGALRAAELDRYGMVGVGDVYAAYRDGRLVGDDEVALLHGPADAGYPAFSQPLVNLRATLAAAAGQGLITAEQRDRLVALLAGMPYPRRTHRVLAELAGALALAPDAARQLAAFCRDHPVDVKRADALLLLGRLTEDAPHRTRPRVNRTIHLRKWELSTRADGSLQPSDAARLRVCKLFARGYPSFHRRLVLESVVRECARGCPGYRDGLPPEQAAVAHGRHRGFYGARHDLDGFGFLSRWTTAAERAALTPEEVLPAFIVRSYRTVPGELPDAPAIERLRGNEAFTHAGRVVEAAQAVQERVRMAGHDSDRLDADRIVGWFAARWEVSSADIELAALDRGFASTADLVAAARSFYLLARCDPGIVALTLPVAEPVGSECPGPHR